MPWVLLGLGFVGVLVLNQLAGNFVGPPQAQSTELQPGGNYVLAVEAPTGLRDVDVDAAVIDNLVFGRVTSNLPTFDRIVDVGTNRWLVRAKYIGNKFSSAFDRRGEHVRASDGVLLLPYEPIARNLGPDQHVTIVSTEVAV